MKRTAKCCVHPATSTRERADKSECEHGSMLDYGFTQMVIEPSRALAEVITVSLETAKIVEAFREVELS